MREFLRLVAMAIIFVAVSVAWLTLGATMTNRTQNQQSHLHGAVADLWGRPHAQRAPTLELRWRESVTIDKPVHDTKGEPVLDASGEVLTREVVERRPRQRTVHLNSSDLTVDLSLDQRRKGLLWFSLYDVDFDGSWTYVHDGPESGTLWIALAFPVADGVYDGFSFKVNDKEVSDQYPPSAGVVAVPVPIKPGDTVAFSSAYRSRGQDAWTYSPSADVGQLRDFSLSLHTDFSDIDFPPFTLSPSSKEASAGGWTLTWEFARLITGHGMGVSLPTPIQPGPLAANMSFSAPISLALYMVWIYVLGLIKRIEVHPINHLFLAASFFSFHLLFGYTVDHLAVEVAFALCAVVSLVLTTTYLRLVVGARFALVEAGLAQVLYLVGFSLAHFWDGYTGLTLTVLGILTLFALMQMTGRMRWSEVWAGRRSP